ncbi:MAG: Mur ligase family protein [Pirellulales bacterium]
MKQNASTNTIPARPATFDGTVVAVTGSIGKSTTARLISAILEQSLHGVTLTRDRQRTTGWQQILAAVEPGHDYAVVDLAAEQAQDVAELSAWRTPWVGVVAQRYETLRAEGWRADEAAATTALLESLPADGWAIVDGDDRLLKQWQAATNARVIRVGRGSECDLAATEIRNAAAGLEFVLEGRRFHVPLGGRHLLHPVLSALAVGRVFGISPANMADSLAELDNRAVAAGQAWSEVTVLANEWRHSPDALRMGLQALQEAPTTGRRVVVCGELDASPERNTQEVFRQLGSDTVTVAGADCLLATGRGGEQMLDGAREAGMPGSGRIAFRHPRELPKLLGLHVKPGDSVLLRGRLENSGASPYRGPNNLSGMSA